MDKALPTFAVAVVVLLAAITLPDREPAPVRGLAPLPEGPIDAVRIESRARAMLHFGENLGLEHYGPDERRPRLHLEGRTLVVTDASAHDGDGREVPDYHFGTFSLFLPLEVRAVRGTGPELDLTAAAPIAALEVVADGKVAWTGDAGVLRIRQTATCVAGESPDPTGAAAAAADAAGAPRGCGDVRIGDGTIGTLEVRTAGAYVWIEDPRRAGEVTLRLPADAGYGLGQARDPGNLHVVAPEVEAPANPSAADADSGTTPASTD